MIAYEQRLSSDATDKRQSEEGEMLLVEQKIGEKVFKNGKPTKFPLPENNVFHLIIADCREYLNGCGDTADYRQMAYGRDGISSEHSLVVHYWKTKEGNLEPIKGLFEKSNPLESARYIQERIHFLGFVTEKEYKEGEIKEKAYYLPNSHLFKNNEDAIKASQTYPLRP